MAVKPKQGERRRELNLSEKNKGERDELVKLKRDGGWGRKKEGCDKQGARASKRRAKGEVRGRSRMESTRNLQDNPI